MSPQTPILLPFQMPTWHGVDLQPWMLLGTGLVLVLFGRRLYWLFFICVGFLLVSWPLQHLIELRQSSWWWQGLPILGGLLGAVLIVFIKKKALKIAGFCSAAYLGYAIAETYLIQPWPWVTLVISGLLGFWLILPLFNGALILLSSCLGSHLIIAQATLPKETQLAGWAFLSLVGIWLQARRGRSKAEAKPGRGRQSPCS